MPKKRPCDDRGIPRTRFARCDFCDRGQWHDGMVYIDADYWTCRRCGTKTTINYVDNIETSRYVQIPKNIPPEKKLGRPPKRSK